MSKGKKEETRDTNEYVVKRNKQLSIMNKKDGLLILPARWWKPTAASV